MRRTKKYRNRRKISRKKRNMRYSKHWGGEVHSPYFTKLIEIFGKGGWETIINLDGMTYTTLIETLKSKYDPSKKLAVFYHNDYNDIIDLPDDVVLFRAGMMKSKQKPNEYIFPVYWVTTPELEPLQKGDKPRLGFCGSIASHPSRQIYLDKLEGDPKLETHFIRRAEFFNGKPGDKQTIEEYENNLKSSEFVFCLRGTGNYSIRFYESLKGGRIPVIINDDIVMPFKEGLIDWPSICVIVNPEEDIADKICEFWGKHDIYKVQMECSRIFREFIAPGKCEQNLYNQINIT
jgi:hypothetical protein